MRIHTDVLTREHIYTAERVARVDFADGTFTEHGSRSRARAFNILLRGESRRAPNMGTARGVDRFGNPERAATWDQWGVFLSVLFDYDPHMFTPYDEDRAHFHDRTRDRFQPTGIVPGGLTRACREDVRHPYFGALRVPQYSLDDMTVQGQVWRIPGSYWPSDAHGDHSWDFGSCRHCSASR